METLEMTGNGLPASFLLGPGGAWCSTATPLDPLQAFGTPSQWTGELMPQHLQAVHNIPMGKQI